MNPFWILDPSIQLRTGFGFSIKEAVQKILFIILSAMLFGLCASVEAQQPKRIPRVGFLIASAASAQESRLEAFKQGLRELGYTDRQNIIIELRSGDGTPERLAAAAAELVRLNVDVIVTGGPSSTAAAKAATNAIPIVMTLEGSPVGEGLVASLARPGGNITGLSSLSMDLSGKRLEILKEIIPSLARVAIFASAIRRKSVELSEIDTSARQLGIQAYEIELRSSTDLESAFRRAIETRAEALLAQSSSVLLSRRKEMAQLAAKHRLPAIYTREEFVAAGGLMHYAPSTSHLSRRAAYYVDKILKGAKPAELPVEQPMKFEFVINLNAAKEIGLTIPPNILARADRVIR
jgi:putative ABC transport system substrate-binding protein